MLIRAVLRAARPRASGAASFGATGVVKNRSDLINALRMPVRIWMTRCSSLFWVANPVKIGIKGNEWSSLLELVSRTGGGSQCLRLVVPELSDSSTVELGLGHGLTSYRLSELVELGEVGR